MAFQHLQPELHQFSLSHMAAIETKEALVQAFSLLPEEKLSKLCSLLSVRDTGVDGVLYKKDFILEIIAEKYEKKTSQLDSINNLALYPTEVSRLYSMAKFQIITLLSFFFFPILSNRKSSGMTLSFGLSFILGSTAWLCRSSTCSF